MLSMSFGLRKLSGFRPAESPPPAPVPIGTPSITKSGSLLALIEVAPRIRTENPPPGSLLSTICTPGTLLLIAPRGSSLRRVKNPAPAPAATAALVLPPRGVFHHRPYHQPGR